MKESYVKGLANHNDPESCGGARKGDGEALTGESAGRVLSRESSRTRDADSVEAGGRQQPWAVLARPSGIPRGLRPQACTEATCARTGRSCVLPSRYAGNASRSLRTYGDDERTQEVGQLRSTNEVCEQTDALGQRGTDGGKAAGQRQCRSVQHVPGSVPDLTCQWH